MASVWVQSWQADCRWFSATEAVNILPALSVRAELKYVALQHNTAMRLAVGAGCSGNHEWVSLYLQPGIPAKDVRFFLRQYMSNIPPQTQAVCRWWLDRGALSHRTPPWCNVCVLWICKIRTPLRVFFTGGKSAVMRKEYQKVDMPVPSIQR